MIEILILIKLGQSIARKAREKGRTGWKAVLLLLGLWFGGEIFGAMVVGIATGAFEREDDGGMLLPYLGALACAVIGAVIAFQVVGSLAPAEPEPEDDDWDRPSRSRRRDDD